jgi:hypothetical protein
MGIGDRDVADHRMRVIGLRGADEHAGVGSRHRGRRDAGIFQGLPGELQQDPLLRIHLLGLTRGNAEDTWIETPDVVEHTGRKGIALATLLSARMAKPRQ